MPYALILRYTLSALVFALAACAIWLIIRLAIVRRPWTRRDGLWLIATGYGAAVIQIIGLRIGLRKPRLLGGELRLTPLYTTLDQWRRGPGSFVYHTLGNLAWFMPLGLLLPALFPRCRWYHALLAGAALSIAVEAAQYLLGTGMSDIDDVLLNALGALLGYAVYRMCHRR